MEARITPFPEWPASTTYLTETVHSVNLTHDQLKHLRSRPDLKSCLTVKLPLGLSTHVTIRRIDNPSHPAHTQFGLFATEDLPPSSLVIPYLGLVHSNDESDTDASSNYDLSLDRDAGLSVDADEMGNEARMTNDYRGVPRPLSASLLKKGEKLGPNAEFRDLWFEYEDGVGERGIGIFVLGIGRSGRGRAGIVKGEEVLVNYGKGFWKERSG